MIYPTLTSIPDNADVLLDANIFIYAFAQKSSECLDLLKRCANEEVVGITTLEVVNEATHRLMLAEALDKGFITKGTADQLKKQRAKIPSLTNYWTSVSTIFQMNLLVLESDKQRLYQAHNIRSQYGLLTNDSLIIAAAMEYGIKLLATNDTDDMGTIPMISIYKPSDI
ncbi:MAG: hypothetical protein A2142_07335 [candidate division Zixibacteria bacterium RBG_16_48_11]|nr:MAG: hypothetical protein A2142_07335 [candidate division Zixibacteria bacterium RBG_16_48_11]